MATIAPVAIDVKDTARPNIVANWLLVIAAMVFGMVVVGGITRLTESGLSITEWDPVSGALPPLSHADWLAEFAKYQQTEQYRTVTGPAGMTLGGFQFIFFWEWAHRQLGRLIGLAFALPLIWFAIRRQIPSGYGPRLLALLALGGLQATVGWWMVQSGLWSGERVSHYRLAVHLLLALFIMAGLIWTAFDLRSLARGGDRPARLTPLAMVVIPVLFIQLLYGAYTAGLRAGSVASTWPLMNDYFFPVGVDWSKGVLFAFVNDPLLIHFIHRWWAWIAVAALVVLGRALRSVDRPASIAIHSAFGLQILLGIATVMTGVSLSLAALHQAVGALLVASVVWGLHSLGSPRSNIIPVSKAASSLDLRQTLRQ
ncbi:MAG: COX15/CtaA family protein [Parasphingorhabdus sp.]|nr:COX15/CtaA family protein [Parasphingorhabdus sp.]